MGSPVVYDNGFTIKCNNCGNTNVNYEYYDGDIQIVCGCCTSLKSEMLGRNLNHTSNIDEIVEFIDWLNKKEIDEVDSDYDYFYVAYNNKNYKFEDGCKENGKFVFYWYDKDENELIINVDGATLNGDKIY